MGLPDISRYSSLPNGTWRAFGRRLQALELGRAFASLDLGGVNALAPFLRKPVRAWHLRRVNHPSVHALRLLMFGDAVTASEAEGVLGELFPSLLDIGLVERAPGDRVRCLYSLGIADDVFLLSDDLTLGPDAVMGYGETTVALCRAALPTERVRRVLEIGTGSGTTAILLAAIADHVVATDVNPRALAMARVNAAINGVDNIELREGSLFEPVGEETFDLVVSQPPFIPKPDSIVAATFLYGGHRGDEIALELLSRISRHLAPGAKAILLIEWPDIEGERLEDRIRSRLAADDVDVLVLKSPATSADEHAATYAGAMVPTLDEGFERDFFARRDHLAKLGIVGMRLTVTVLQKSSRGAGRTSALDIEPASRIRLSRDRIERILAARDLAPDRERLLASTLRVPEGTILAQEQNGPGAEVPSTLMAKFSADLLIGPIGITNELLAMITFIHEASTVREGIERLAEACDASYEDASAQTLPAIEEALLRGLLEVASSEGVKRAE